MPTWTFVKRGGAPTGTINFDVAAGAFALNDTTLTSFVTTDPQMAGELFGHPYVTLSGVVATAPSPQQVQGVELVDGVLSTNGPGGSYLPIPQGPAGPPGLVVNFRGGWVSGTTYAAGSPPDGVLGSDNHWYVSLSNANIGNNPTTDGGVHWADTTPPTLSLKTQNPALTPLTLTGAAGQSADYISAKDSTGSRKFRVASDGSILAGREGTTIPDFQFLAGSNPDLHIRRVVVREQGDLAHVTLGRGGPNQNTDRYAPLGASGGNLLTVATISATGYYGPTAFVSGAHAITSGALVGGVLHLAQIPTWIRAAAPTGGVWVLSASGGTTYCHYIQYTSIDATLPNLLGCTVDMSKSIGGTPSTGLTIADTSFACWADPGGLGGWADKPASISAVVSEPSGFHNNGAVVSPNLGVEWWVETTKNGGATKLISGIFRNNGPLEWVTRAFSAYLSTDQAFTGGTDATIIYDTKDVTSDGVLVDDEAGWYNASTGRFTPATPGKYTINASAAISESVATRVILSLWKNGTLHRQLDCDNGISDTAKAWHGSVDVIANGTGDYFEIKIRMGGSATQHVTGSQTKTWFQAIYGGRRFAPLA